jgi:hypothetical protein
MSTPKTRDLDPADIDIIEAKFLDALTPGFEAEFTLDEAEEAGAFREDALSEEDAKESAIEVG